MAYGMGGDVAMSRTESVKIAPDISVGENKITSNVNVTYEIK